MPIAVGKNDQGETIYRGDYVQVLAVGPLQSKFKYLIHLHGIIIGFGGPGNARIRISDLNHEVEIPCHYLKKIESGADYDLISINDL